MQPERTPAASFNILPLLDEVAAADPALPATERLLEELATDLKNQNARAQAILANPTGYFHDNGFLKVEFGRSTCGRIRLRMHLWGLGAKTAPRQQIHNHSFDFVSLAFRGSVRLASYAVHPCDEPAAWYRYGYHRKDRLGHPQYQLRYYGPCRATLLSEVILEAGRTYAMIGTDFHTADPLVTSASTLLISREHDTPADAFILFDNPHEGTTHRNSVPLAPAHIVRLLDAHMISETEN